MENFYKKCKRNLFLMNKPSINEFKRTAIISTIGLGLIGFLGFSITIIMNFI